MTLTKGLAKRSPPKCKATANALRRTRTVNAAGWGAAAVAAADDTDYDYTTRPFGDALALLECLDELTAPLDMNECIQFVVDVIFRTAQILTVYTLKNVFECVEDQHFL